MPDGFLPRTSRINRVERQGDLDQPAGGFDGGVGHEVMTKSEGRMANGDGD